MIAPKPHCLGLLFSYTAPECVGNFKEKRQSCAHAAECASRCDQPTHNHGEALTWDDLNASCVRTKLTTFDLDLVDVILPVVGHAN